MLKDNWAICSLLIYRPKGSVPENAFDDFQSQCRSHFLTVKINFCLNQQYYHILENDVVLQQTYLVFGKGWKSKQLY